MKIVTLFFALMFIVACAKNYKEPIIPAPVIPNQKGYIYAGQSTGGGIIYTDLIPDGYLSRPAGTNPNFDTYFELDLNKDGINDFQLHRYYVYSGPSGPYAFYTQIRSYNNNEIAYRDSFSAPGYSFFLLLPDTINLNDRIDSDLSWGNIIFLSYSNISEYYPPFIGAKIYTTNGDTLFGWIDVDYTYPAYYILDYACTSE